MHSFNMLCYELHPGIHTTSVCPHSHYTVIQRPHSPNLHVFFMVHLWRTMPVSEMLDHDHILCKKCIQVLIHIIYKGHRCEKPGCGQALVLDGNMKNHRDVCCATYAGYAEFSGLPGRVRTGCPNTPAFKSPYCSVHKPMLAVPQRIQLPEEDSDFDINVPQPDINSKEEPAGIIIEKRATRNSTFYKVITNDSTLFNTFRIHIDDREPPYVGSLQSFYYKYILAGSVVGETINRQHMGAGFNSP